MKLLICLLSEEIRAEVRQLVTPSSNSLLKALVLSNLGGEPRTYIDSIYLRNIIVNADATLLPAVCTVIVSLTNKSELLDDLLGAAVSRPTLKPSVIAMLRAKLFEVRSEAGKAQIENLRVIYEEVPDPEIRSVLLKGLQRLAGDHLSDNDGINFAKCHRQLAMYNECFLFEHSGQPMAYNFLELIPLSRLRQHVSLDIDVLKRVIEDLSEKEVLPSLTFAYDAGSEEVCLQMRIDKEFKQVVEADFSLELSSILVALRLAVHVFKKASYFRRMFGRAPFIHINNLLVNEGHTDIRFRTIGMSLRSPYQIGSVGISDEEEDIARMVGFLLAHLLVGTSNDIDKFIKTPHTGVESFLVLFIRNMFLKSRTPAYSCSRFEYLVNELTAAAMLGEHQVAALYMRERLKSTLFNRNSQRVTWYGVSGAVSRHISHLRAICSKETLREFEFRNRLTLLLGPTRQLHNVSRQLLNLALNRGIKPTGSDLNQPYASLLDNLLLFSAVTIEVLSLFRSVCRSLPPARLNVSKTYSHVRISAAGYDNCFDLSDITAAAASVSMELEYKSTQALGDLSLTQMMLRILLLFHVRSNEDCLDVSEGHALPTSVFTPLAHACLVRVPRIEQDIEIMVSAVLEALQNNDEIVLPINGTNLREDLITLAGDFGRVRKHLRIRRDFGVANGRPYFPPDVMCKSLLRKTIKAKESSLPGTPLTSKLPASKYRCSWDVQKGTVVNLIVPDDALNGLLFDLKAGKFFGLKFSYLYSGKMMMIYDLLIAFVAFALLALCHYGEGFLKYYPIWSAILSASSRILVTIFVGFAGKLVIWDIGHWLPGWKSWIKSLQSANDKDINNPG